MHQSQHRAIPKNRGGRDRAAAARLPKSRRGADHKRFLEAYYANVDAEDMAARDPAALAGAALSHLGVRAPAPRPRAGPRVQSDRARTRLHLAAHRHRDGERRHAVPRRFDRACARRGVRSPCIFWRTRSSPFRATAPASCARIEERGRGRRTSTSVSSRSSMSRWIGSSIPRCSQSLCEDIERSMRDVRVACADWAKMRAAARRGVR